MRTSLVLAMAAVLAVIFWANPASAQKKQQPDKPQPPIGTNPHPVVGNSARPTPARSLPPPRNSAPAARHFDRRDEPVQQPMFWYYQYGRPLYYYDDGRIGYRYPYNYAYPYGYEPYYYFYPYYSYPMPVPACFSMGPGAGAQGGQPLMGRDNGVPPPPQADDEPEPKSRPTNARANATAWKSIGYGDALFAKQRYAEAADRYRRASSTAPQLADAWFRRAFALTAIHRYDLAVDSIKRGLKLDPKWPKIAFDAKDSLWTDAEAKKEYFATLAKLAAENPADPNILFLVGVHFHVDGQEEQAQKYFNHALRITGNSAEHIDAFLGPGT